MNYTDKKIIVSVSGGKDSTAMCLDLLEQGYSKSDFIRIFADTGWEDKKTYAYLKQLEDTIGDIIILKAEIEIKEEYREYIEEIENMLGFESPMVRQSFKYLFFPSSVNKFCTKKLKIEPIKKYFDNLDDDYVNLVGIRKEESPRRSKMTEWEYNDYFDCWTHRPIIDWNEKQVIDIHHRFNLVPNKLYLEGYHRVGCYPCINSRKSEIKLLDPHRVSVIRRMEKIFSLLREAKGKKPATFFYPVLKSNHETMYIDRVMEWSKTTRGGQQFELFSTDEPTCVKWGMCNL